MTTVPSARHAARVGLIQTLLALFCWVAIGFLNARGTWLLENGQAYQATRLLLYQLPLVGLLGAAVVPVLWYVRLLRETSVDGLLDTDFVRRALAFPQVSALAGLFTTVLLFLSAGWHLRRTMAIPPIEAGKIGVLGLLTGTLLAVLTYFFLQPSAGVLVRNALERGAMAPIAATFPIRKKILASCVAVALLVAGLFGMQAVAWAQRYVEESSAVEAERVVEALSREAAARVPQGREEWSALLARSTHPAESALFAANAAGTLMATVPAEPSSLEAHLLRSDFLAASAATKEGAFVVRWGDVRIVARRRLAGHETVGAVVRPRPDVLRGVLRSVLVVTGEAVLAAFLLAWVAGRGMTRPLELLGRNASAYARETTEPAPTVSVVTDDEIALLGVDLDRMAEAQRAARQKLLEASRRDERDAVLARVAHEVRNPLFGISSTLSALEHELGAGAHAEYFAILRSEGQRLSRLIDEMMAAGPAAVSPDRSLPPSQGSDRKPDSDSGAGV